MIPQTSFKSLLVPAIAWMLTSIWSEGAARAGDAPPPAPPAMSTNDDALLASASAKPATPFVGEGWTQLFDGKSLAGWKETSFVAHGDSLVAHGLLVVEEGDRLTGVNYTNAVPTTNYEVAFDALKVRGADFFCALTVPVGESHCTLVLGGWGGSITGVSSIDGLDASENETSGYVNFDPGVWYRVRMRVASGKIEAWLDDKQIVNFAIAGHELSMRVGEIEMSQPFGLATYETTAAFREIRIRRLEGLAGGRK